MNKQTEWRKQHLKNMIWSAKHKGGLFGGSDAIGFKKELGDYK